MQNSRTLAVALAALALAAPSCKPKPVPPQTEAHAAGTGRHPLTGTILSVNRERGTLLVEHDDIPGVMPHMTMEFQVVPGDLAVAREGARIRATMVQSPEGFFLEQIWPEDAAAQRTIGAAEKALRDDTVTRGSQAYREVGETAPDFALYDQDGAVVQASRFRGKQVALNFIFTRCPDAKMCPASTMKMMQLQAMAHEAGVPNLEIVSVTLDPDYDTPGVLHDYAEARGIDTRNFTFLTGPEGAIKDLLTQFGVLAFQDGPLVRHTLSTVLIDENGRIIHRVDGSDWRADDFAARLRRPVATVAK